SPDQIQQAFALLRQNETEIGSNVEDTRAQIVLLSHQTPKPGEEPSPRRRAIELLERLAQNTQGSGDDRFLLAKLYDADKAWDKADKSYRAAIAADPKNAALLSYYIRRLLQQNKLAEAVEPLKHLERLAPDAAGTVALRARHQFQSGEATRMMADLASFANGG